MDGSTTIPDTRAYCQRCVALATAYAEDAVNDERFVAEEREASDQYIRLLESRIEDLKGERDLYRDFCIAALRRAEHLTAICWRQRIALDDRSRQDDNYSQGTDAHRHLEEAIAHRERTNALRFKAPSASSQPESRGYTTTRSSTIARHRLNPAQPPARRSREVRA